MNGRRIIFVLLVVGAIVSLMPDVIPVVVLGDNDDKVLTVDADVPSLIVVQGADGASEYGEQFTKWRERWVLAGKKGGAKVISLPPANDTVETTRELLKQAIASQASKSPQPLWIVLIGHGTYDGRAAKFNLQGPDLSATELATWLEAVKRPVAVVNCSSASAPFIDRLKSSDRVIVTATKSGYELNFSRFGDYMSKAISDEHADLDKDGQTSLLEAYLTASRATAEWYNTESRLATEQALLDDNGDGRGTPADWFRGVRAVKKTQDNSTVDGLRAHQFHLVPSDRERGMPAELRAKRNALELEIAKLRDRRKELGDEAYYSELEKLAVSLANLYATIDAGK